MLPMLLLSILIQFGTGELQEVTTGDPVVKCDLDWEAKYHPENHTLRTEIVIDYRKNSNCYDFFYLGSYEILLNADGQNIQAIRLNKNVYGYETYIFHDVEPCRSYEMVLTLIPRINYFEDLKYTFAFDHEYKKIIETGHDHCEKSIVEPDDYDDSYNYEMKRIVETNIDDDDNTTCSLGEALPELKAEYQPEDGGSVSVWFEVPESRYEPCFETFLVSWGLDWEITQSKIAYFKHDSAIQKHVFYDMDLYMPLFDRRNNNTCREIDLVLQPCYNLSHCEKIWDPLIYFFDQTAAVRAKANFCVNTTIEMNGKDLDEPGESIQPSEMNGMGKEDLEDKQGVCRKWNGWKKEEPGVCRKRKGLGKTSGMGKDSEEPSNVNITVGNELNGDLEGYIQTVLHLII